MKTKILEIINAILRERDLDPVSETDISRYIEPDIDDADSIYLSKFNCTKKTIYYYKLFKYNFDSRFTVAPELSCANIKLMNKFKAVIGEAKTSKMKVYGGENVILAARRYAITLIDDSFFYSEILSADEFLNRMSAWMDGGSIWTKYIYEKQKNYAMPARLRTFGYIYYEDASDKIKEDINKKLSRKIVSVKSANLNDGKSERPSKSQVEAIVSDVFMEMKIWSGKALNLYGYDDVKIDYRNAYKKYYE